MRSLKLLYLTFFLMLSGISNAQEMVFSKEEIYRSQQNYEPSISPHYFRGKNLIYDCIEKHYACVSDFNFDICTDERKAAITNRDVLLPCAPLKQMPQQIDCFRLQYTLIHSQTYKGFCISQKKID